jgi:uncharacterized protein (DUF58 family)
MVPASRHRHLDPETLAKLAGLQLRVQAVVEGTLSGLHRSPHHGSSVEFAEHKEYTPGDDLRHLDWKAFGKFDRYYIKRFEDETDLKAYLLLDCSGSMEYGAPLSKLEVASVLCASLAFFLSRQGDQPGLLAFADRVRAYLPPRARSAHLGELLATLEGLKPGGSTDLARAVLHLTEVIAHRTMVVVVSDLFTLGADGLRLLRSLRARNHHVVLFHLLHPDELELPFSELTLFESMEDERSVLCDPGGIRRAYLAEIAHFLEESRRICRESEIEYHQISTAQPVHEVLLRFLQSSRRRRATARARGSAPIGGARLSGDVPDPEARGAEEKAE